MNTSKLLNKPMPEVDLMNSEPREQHQQTIKEELDAKWPPLVPVKAEQPTEACEGLLLLTYHPDVADEEPPSPLIVLGSPSRAAGFAVMSRRVVLFNLPPDTNAAQVILGICHTEGLLSVTITPDPMQGSRTRVAELVFERADDAQGVVRHMEYHPVCFESGDRSRYEAKVWLVPTPSYRSSQERAWHDLGYTRCLTMESVPVGLVWQTISVIDVRQVCSVCYDRNQGRLDLEMTSVRESVKAHDNIKVALGFEASYSKRTSICIHGSADEVALVRHMALSQVAMEWNTWPWNQEEETPEIDWAAEREALRPARERALAESLDIDVEELGDYLESRAKFTNIDYYIIGSRIKLTRKAWSWSISVDDDHKLLMANTLHDPEWAQEWDETFEAEGVPNLRTWERYGMLAQHRREKAREQGLEDWEVPNCYGTCEWGCCPLEACPVPEVVKRYLEQKIPPRDDSDEEHEDEERSVDEYGSELSDDCHQEERIFNYLACSDAPENEEDYGFLSDEEENDD
ncbi:hypothetical protein CP532_4049 [Ophiocordyceps camponoti-leonardi (nom. inval.)]|nr:hypothetical protein CP532_4049 [Ophiocordyceps camponoti-leonardi (nom. inval.)]